MMGKGITTHRSNKSDRVATSAILVRMTGRIAWKMTNSASVYSWRAKRLPPVESRQRASENCWLTADKLSNTKSQVLLAAIINSCSLRGSDLNGATFGSINRQRVFAAVD